MRSDRCAGVLAGISIACVLGLTAQTPTPDSSPLPTIGGTHARGLCTTVRDRVAPMVAGLMKSDEVIAAGHRGFAKMSVDMRAKNPDALDLDRNYLSKVAAAIAHNLGVIDSLLADDKRFPKQPKTDDDRIAQTLATQLRAVADQQRKALDLINGAVETDAMGHMRTEFTKGLGPGGGVTAPVSREDPSGKTDVLLTTFLDAGVLPMNAAPPGADPRTNQHAAATDPRQLATSANAIGRTVYDLLNQSLEQRVAAITQAEYTLTPTVVGISVACREELAPKQP